MSLQNYNNLVQSLAIQLILYFGVLSFFIRFVYNSMKQTQISLIIALLPYVFVHSRQNCQA